MLPRAGSPVLLPTATRPLRLPRRGWLTWSAGAGRLTRLVAVSPLIRLAVSRPAALRAAAVLPARRLGLRLLCHEALPLMLAALDLSPLRAVSMMIFSARRFSIPIIGMRTPTASSNVTLVPASPWPASR